MSGTPISDALTGISAELATAKAGLDAETAKVRALEAPIQRGPAAASSFITIAFDRPITTAGLVSPECFGVASGGLSNRDFGDLATNRNNLQSKLKALAPGLLRLNSNWEQNAADLTAFVSTLGNSLPKSTRLVVGLTNPNAIADDAAVLASGPIIPSHLEWQNEPPDPGSAAYNAGLREMIDIARASLPHVMGAGPVSAGLNTGAMRSLYASVGGGYLGLADFHQYLYCAAQDPVPTDTQLCLGQNGRGADLFPALAQSIDTAAGLPPDMPVLLGEFANECDASASDLRAGTSRGVGLYICATLGGQAATGRPWWTAWWDAYDDPGAAYQLIDTGGNCFPVYYCIQRIAQRAPGQLVSVTGNPGGMRAFATHPPTTAGFCVGIVNGNASAQIGQVALSRVPVNSSGTFSAKWWSYPTSPGRSPVANQPGSESTVAVTGGLTEPITVPAYSGGILSLT